MTLFSRRMRLGTSLPRTVLITGATGGIGSALAESYAEPGRTLILHGRNLERLAALKQSCEARGARVVSLAFDLRDPQSATRELNTVSEREPIELAIVNAGVTHMLGSDEEAETFETAREVLAVNLDGALATIAAVVPAMSRRGSGQIAVMSSLAAYVGLPRTPSYSASKAALLSYGDALRRGLAPCGIAVNIVLPGFVHTNMTAALKGPKPAAMSAGRAARLIRRGLERNRARIAFPRAFAMILLVLSLMPARVSDRLLRMSGLS